MILKVFLIVLEYLFKFISILIIKKIHFLLYLILFF